MMKYALSNPDEFSYPISAFFVGFFSFSSVLVGEVINLLNIQTQTEVARAIISFIGFKAIIDLPKNYMDSFDDLPLKKAVDKELIKMNKRKETYEKITHFHKLLNYLYFFCKIFYKSVYFYFFPFGASLIPLIYGLKKNI